MLQIDSFGTLSNKIVDNVTALSSSNRKEDDKFNELRKNMVTEIGKQPAVVVASNRTQELMNNLGRNVDLFV